MKIKEDNWNAEKDNEADYKALIHTKLNYQLVQKKEQDIIKLQSAKQRQLDNMIINSDINLAAQKIEQIEFENQMKERTNSQECGTGRNVVIESE